MVESILVYTLLAFVMITGGNIHSPKQSFIHNRDYDLSFVIPILTFTFVFGCRYDVGVDYHHYLAGYLYGNERESERVFRFITATMADNGIHYSIYFSLWAFIQIALIYYSLRKYQYIFPYLVFFLIFGTYFMSLMNVMRQQLAACVFMVSLQYIESKKLIKYVLCIVVASIFHRSAWLLLIAYPALAWKNNWLDNIKLQLIIYVSALVISVSYGERITELIEQPFVLFTQITGYDDTYRYAVLEIEALNSRSQFGNNSGLGLYIGVLLNLPIMLFSSRIKTFYHNTYLNMVYILWFVGIIGSLLFGNSIILFRPFVYVVNFRMVMYAFFAHYCIKQKKELYNYIWGGYVLLHIAMFLNMLSNGEINKSRFLFFWEV